MSVHIRSTHKPIIVQTICVTFTELFGLHCINEAVLLRNKEVLLLLLLLLVLNTSDSLIKT